MKEKNVKGIIGLCFALASLVCAFVSFIPMTKLTGMGFDGKISFLGPTNTVLGWIVIIFAVIAIIFSILSKKDADKKGPRKSGMVVGIICIIIGICSLCASGLFSTITEYINSDGKSGVIAESIKNNPEQEKTINEFVNSLKDSMK